MQNVSPTRNMLELLTWMINSDDSSSLRDTKGLTTSPNYSLFSPLHKRSHGQTNFIASLNTKENGIRLIMERKNESNGSKGFIPGRYHNKLTLGKTLDAHNDFFRFTSANGHSGSPKIKVSGIYPSFRNIRVPKERKKTTIKKFVVGNKRSHDKQKLTCYFFFADLNGNQRDRVREIEDFLGFYHHRFIYVRV